MAKALRFTPSQRRHATSTLFAVTALAAVITVAASNVLPCPVKPKRGRFADSEEDGVQSQAGVKGITVVARRPSRWIQETHPTA
jgi:cytochrome c oxidase assembly factor 2